MRKVSRGCLLVDTMDPVFPVCPEVTHEEYVSRPRTWCHLCCWAFRGHTEPLTGGSAPRPVPRTPGWPPRRRSCSGYLRANPLHVPGDTCLLAQVCLHLPRQGWSGPASAGVWPAPRARGEMGLPPPAPEDHRGSTGPQALPRRRWLEVAEQGDLRVLQWLRCTGGDPKARAFSRDHGERGETLQKPRLGTGGQPRKSWRDIQGPAGASADCPWAEGDWRRRGPGLPQSPASNWSRDHRVTVPTSTCGPQLSAQPSLGQDSTCAGVSLQAGVGGSGPGARSDRQRSARTPLCLDGCWVSLRVRAFQFKKSYLVKIFRKKMADLI